MGDSILIVTLVCDGPMQELNLKQFLFNSGNAAPWKCPAKFTLCLAGPLVGEWGETFALQTAIPVYSSETHGRCLGPIIH